jgi:hypothetical protein
MKVFKLHNFLYVSRSANWDGAVLGNFTKLHFHNRKFVAKLRGPLISYIDNAGLEVRFHTKNATRVD